MSNVLSYKENDVIVGKTHATKIDYHKYMTVAKNHGLIQFRTFSVHQFSNPIHVSSKSDVKNRG